MYFGYNYRGLYKPWYECGWYREQRIRFPKTGVKNYEVIHFLKKLYDEIVLHEQDGYKVQIKVYVNNSKYCFRKSEIFQYLISLLKKELF